MSYCPFHSNDRVLECNKTNCALWCDGEKECSLKVIALQLIKLEEKEVATADDNHTKRIRND